MSEPSLDTTFDRSQPAARPQRVGTTFANRMFAEFAWVWYATVALFLVSYIVAPGTVRLGALMALLPFAAILAIVAVGQTIVIQQRGLDMSAGGMITLGGLFVAQIGFATGSILIAAILTILIAAVLGMLNGVLVARLNITPIVATLATNAFFMAGIRTLSGGNSLTAPAEAAYFAHGRILGIPYILLVALAFILLVNFVINRTVLGRRFVAVGSSVATASAAGIRVLPFQIGAYAAASACFAVAGILYTGFVGSVSPIAGNDYLLPSIAAVVVGGTAFTGGRGSVIASGVAALFMAQLNQLVLALGADISTQFLVQALVIVVAVGVRYLPHPLPKSR